MNKRFLLLLMLLAFPAFAVLNPGTPVDSKRTREYAWSEYLKLNSQELEKLDISDPLLRSAYARMFLNVGDPSDWEKAVIFDIKRRGSDATQLLLSLFEENPEKDFRRRFMGKLGEPPMVAAETFLAATRKLYYESRADLDVSTLRGMIPFLLKYGGKEDLKILTELQDHPSGTIRHLAKVYGRDMQRKWDVGNVVQERRASALEPVAPFKSSAELDKPEKPRQSRSVGTKEEKVPEESNVSFWISAMFAALLVAVIAWRLMWQGRSPRSGCS